MIQIFREFSQSFPALVWPFVPCSRFIAKTEDFDIFAEHRPSWVIKECWRCREFQHLQCRGPIWNGIPVDDVLWEGTMSNGRSFQNDTPLSPDFGRNVCCIYSSYLSNVLRLQKDWRWTIQHEGPFTLLKPLIVNQIQIWSCLSLLNKRKIYISELSMS